MRRAIWATVFTRVCLFGASLLVASGVAFAGQLRTPYIDPAYFLNIPFGTHSHWAQPWRAYLETVPATVFVNGTGINFNVNSRQADDVAEMLGKHGIHHGRIEVNWGSFDYDHEDRMLGATGFAHKLTALQRNGIRPLILLNANSGAPCPLRTFRKTIVTNARSGDRTIALDSADGVTAGYSGLSNVGHDKGAARILIVALEGNIATLSKPLPVDLAAGTTVELATLKYRPFSAPGSPDFAATIGGWQAFAENTARIVRNDLGTNGKPDAGFDLEIWNELTFGSTFLSIDNYYATPAANPESNVWGLIVAATAATAVSRPDLFSGVLIGDGFANTIPWPASATEPARIAAIDKHPYAGRKTYPQDAQKGRRFNAAMQQDDYVPAYTVNFPEYFATLMQTETIVRDMGPLGSDVYGKLHGRNARLVNGRPNPVSVWITEVNTSPVEDDPTISAAAALGVKEKTTARYFSFYLNKGVRQLDLYAAKDKDTSLGIVRDNFLAYADAPAAPYPADDSAYLSPALLVTGRMVDRMKNGLDVKLTQTRPLTVTAVAAAHDPLVFKGDGTATHPDLHAVDVFAFLPFEVNAHRFVIPYYVMTRDVMKAWPDDLFNVTVLGFSPKARFSVYDPFTDKTAGIPALPTATGQRLTLSTSDYPRMLVVDEGDV